jgi:heme/copper-type cytochrome/quinol oxidase subunit 2
MVVVGMTFLFVVPGLLFAFLLALSSMIYFCEHRKGMEALLGSWHYVSRFFWGFVLRMMGGLFLMLLFSFVFVGLVDVFFGINLGAKIEEKNTLSFFWYSINSFFQNGIFVPLSLLFLYEIYKDMKSLLKEKETQEQRIKRKRWLYLGISLAPLVIVLFLSLVSFLLFSGFWG